jgi:hypothetical protein
MKVTCPACYAQFTLDAALGADASRKALATALAMPAPLATQIAQYLGMFRSPNRAVSPDRLEKLMAELLPMLQAEEVWRNGNSRRAPLKLWQEGFAHLVVQRDNGKLGLPLKSHGYLLEVVYSSADRVEAIKEQQVELTRQSGKHRSEADKKHAYDDVILRIENDLRMQLITPEVAAERKQKALQEFRHE